MEIAYAIYVNDSEFPFTDWILEGFKTEETRNSHSLDRFIGQRVGIIRTGVGKPTLVGYVTIDSVFEYHTISAWEESEVCHRIPKEYDGKYGYKYGKCGYALSYPERCHAQVLESIKGNRIWREI